MATVIKAGQSGPLLRRLSTLNLHDHLVEARDCLQEAHDQAERLLADAERKALQLQSEACHRGEERGYRDGFEKGKHEGEKSGFEFAERKAIEMFNERQSELVSDLRRTIEEIQRVKEDVAVAARRDVLDFAVSLATKLTMAIGTTYSQAACVNLERALAVVGEKSDLTVRVNPRDYSAMEMFAPTILKQVASSSTVRLIPDEGIQPGGCIVSNDRTIIDATLATQLEELVTLILGTSEDHGR